MAASFYFYDIETSGFSPKEARVMQFAGQRTDLNLKPVGEPHNFLIKMTDDVLPDPYSILVTGITPQKTIAEGITEAEFLKIFNEEVATPDTIIIGFNTIRFDDEFLRYMHYRNFHDPYEWQWRDGRSKWDLLDVARITRALRPKGIEWPFDASGKASNRLELLTAVNKLDHAEAHDALNDVMASIAVAQLLRQKQPKLFDFLFTMRLKQNIASLVNGGEPFIYTSGVYASETEKTTIVAKVTDHPKRQGIFVFDLRYDPEKFTDLTPAELAVAWRKRKDEPGPRLPIKTLQFNRCPAIAPLSTLDKDSEARLQLNMDEVMNNFEKLKNMRPWIKKVLEAHDILEKKLQMRLLELEEQQTVDAQLYDGFFEDEDRQAMREVRSAEPHELAKLKIDFEDRRLKSLFPLYKARNFPNLLNTRERQEWEKFRSEKLLKGGEKSLLSWYFARISDIEQKGNLTSHQQYLLEELQLYGQTIMPDGS